MIWYDLVQKIQEHIGDRGRKIYIFGKPVSFTTVLTLLQRRAAERENDQDFHSSETQWSAAVIQIRILIDLHCAELENNSVEDDEDNGNRKWNHRHVHVHASVFMEFLIFYFYIHV